MYPSSELSISPLPLAGLEASTIEVPLFVESTFVVSFLSGVVLVVSTLDVSFGVVLVVSTLDVSFGVVLVVSTFVVSFGVVFVVSTFVVSFGGTVTVSFTVISPFNDAFFALLPSVVSVNLNVPALDGVPEIFRVFAAESTLAATPDGKPLALTPVQNENLYVISAIGLPKVTVCFSLAVPVFSNTASG